MKDILFISNGHGEDLIASRIIAALRAQPQILLSIDAWPMVGHGLGYGQVGIEAIGARNLLPSDGFATLDWKLMWKDLRAGWLATHWMQLRFALELHRHYHLIVAVGDMVPVGAAIFSRTPFFFVGCAKSTYYDNVGAYSIFEKWLLRRSCLNVFPRDALTAKEFLRSGVPNEYLGTPVMDGLVSSHERPERPQNACVVALLTGSRSDAEQNALKMMSLITHLASNPAEKFVFAFALHDTFNVQKLDALIAQRKELSLWKRVEPKGDQCGERKWFQYWGAHESQIYYGKGLFAEILDMADIVVGMAGTANEQAIGLGKPLIAMPSTGSQGRKFVDMKSDYFGEAAITIDCEPVAFTEAIRTLRENPALRSRMAAAGRERMGVPGASAAISARILDYFHTHKRQTADSVGS